MHDRQNWQKSYSVQKYSPYISIWWVSAVHFHIKDFKGIFLRNVLYNINSCVVYQCFTTWQTARCERRRQLEHERFVKCDTKFLSRKILLQPHTACTLHMFVSPPQWFLWYLQLMLVFLVGAGLKIECVLNTYVVDSKCWYACKGEHGFWLIKIEAENV